MNDLGGPLTALRAAIEGRVNAETTSIARQIRAVHWEELGGSLVRDAEMARDESRVALDAELARVEARIGRLARFVVAWDAHRVAVDHWQESPTWPPATQDELDAARAAITDIDL